MDHRRRAGHDPDHEHHDHRRGDEAPAADVALRSRGRRRRLPRRERAWRRLGRSRRRRIGAHGAHGFNPRILACTVTARAAHHPPDAVGERSLLVGPSLPPLPAARLTLGAAPLPLAGDLVLGEWVAPLFHLYSVGFVARSR